MTKNFGQDFDFDHPNRDNGKKGNGLAYKLLPKVVDFVMPVLLGLAALYVGKYWLGS
jgi:hypothetical protein